MCVCAARALINQTRQKMKIMKIKLQKRLGEAQISAALQASQKAHNRWISQNALAAHLSIITIKIITHCLHLSVSPHKKKTDEPEVEESSKFKSFLFQIEEPPLKTSITGIKTLSASLWLAVLSLRVRARPLSISRGGLREKLH